MLELLLQKLFKYDFIDYGYSDQWLLFDVTMIVNDGDVGKYGMTRKIDYVKIAEGKSDNLVVYLYNNIDNFMDCYESETIYERKFILEVSLFSADM